MRAHTCGLMAHVHRADDMPSCAAASVRVGEDLLPGWQGEVYQPVSAHRSSSAEACASKVTTAAPAGGAQSSSSCCIWAWHHAWCCCDWQPDHIMHCSARMPARHKQYTAQAQAQTNMLAHHLLPRIIAPMPAAQHPPQPCSLPAAQGQECKQESWQEEMVSLTACMHECLGQHALHGNLRPPCACTAPRTSSAGLQLSVLTPHDVAVKFAFLILTKHILLLLVICCGAGGSRRTCARGCTPPATLPQLMP